MPSFYRGVSRSELVYRQGKKRNQQCSKLREAHRACPLSQVVYTHTTLTRVCAQTHIHTYLNMRNWVISASCVPIKPSSTHTHHTTHKRMPSCLHTHHTHAPARTDTHTYLNMRNSSALRLLHLYKGSREPPSEEAALQYQCNHKPYVAGNLEQSRYNVPARIVR
jgi:hypothetical protein